MQKTLVYVALLVGAAAFLGMLKLMYDMTGHMARMTDQVAVMSADLGRMNAQMGTLVEQVTGIKASVGHMPSLAEDVHGLRESVGTMAGAIQRGSQQVEKLNPMEMFRQVIPPAQRR